MSTEPLKVTTISKEKVAEYFDIDQLPKVQEADGVQSYGIIIKRQGKSIDPEKHEKLDQFLKVAKQIVEHEVFEAFLDSGSVIFMQLVNFDARGRKFSKKYTRIESNGDVFGFEGDKETLIATIPVEDIIFRGMYLFYVKVSCTKEELEKLFGAEKFTHEGELPNEW